MRIFANIGILGNFRETSMPKNKLKVYCYKLTDLPLELKICFTVNR